MDKTTKPQLPISLKRKGVFSFFPQPSAHKTPNGPQYNHPFTRCLNCNRVITFAIPHRSKVSLSLIFFLFGQFYSFSQMSPFEFFFTVFSRENPPPPPPPPVRSFLTHPPQITGSWFIFFSRDPPPPPPLSLLSMVQLNHSRCPRAPWKMDLESWHCCFPPYCLVPAWFFFSPVFPTPLIHFASPAKEYTVPPPPPLFLSFFYVGFFCYMTPPYPPTRESQPS